MSLDELSNFTSKTGIIGKRVLCSLENRCDARGTPQQSLRGLGAALAPPCLSLGCELRGRLMNAKEKYSQNELTGDERVSPSRFFFFRIILDRATTHFKT